MQPIEDQDDDDDGLSTEREVVKLLASWVTMRGHGTADELHATIHFLIDIMGPKIAGSLIGSECGPLNDAERRMILVDAICRTWMQRIDRRAPTQKEFLQAFEDVGRLLGDDPTYGLPRKRRRASTRRARHVGEVIQLVPPATQDSENNGDETEADKS